MYDQFLCTALVKRAGSDMYHWRQGWDAHSAKSDHSRILAGWGVDAK